MPARKQITLFLLNIIVRGMIGAALLIPYHRRVPVFGWIFTRIVAPLSGRRKRIRNNLSHVLPDLPEAKVRALCLSVPDRAGRAFVELFSGRDLKRRAARAAVEGPGLAAMESARATGRPVILVTGHFGNYDMSRAALIARGFNVGALYRPMSNRFFNSYYERTVAGIGEPVFPRSREGLSGMVRFLRGGGVLGFFIDNHVSDGTPFDFFGKPALTSLSPAKMALKYDALILSAYAVRLENGLDFRIRLNAPLDHTTPEQMTRQLTGELEDMVRRHMDQWLFWMHRRWKPRKRPLA